MRLYSILLVLATHLISISVFSQENKTPTYPELIEAYKTLASDFPETIKMEAQGQTDCGLPLHTIVINGDREFTPEKIHAKGKVVCMIMNGIHPGEACGINASLSFARSKAETPDPNVVYVIIPVYNIGGALNRGSFSRANQDGPEEHGFRGNAQNLDLNRDFIKSDSKNALAFAEIFHFWNPEIFVDTHTSNGADYQPTLTLLTTFPEKLSTFQAKFLSMEFEPSLFTQMKELDDEMVPYVFALSGTPDHGISAFTDLARYSIGYTALFNTIGFTTEAHMLKPFDDRVKSTLNFLHVLGNTINEKHNIIVDLKKVADKQDLELTSYQTGWKVSSKADSILFPGYTADTTTSALTGLPRLSYNRNEPFRKNIAHYRFHESSETIELPKYYVVSPATDKLKTLLEANAIEFSQTLNDSTLSVESVYISDFETVDNPYEGHYLHFDTHVQTRAQEIDIRKGDLIIPSHQKGSKFLAEVFHPQCPDSYFNWNYYDSALQQKEYFSPYVFEDTAAEIVAHDPQLKKALAAKVESDPEFAKNAWSQLYFIYQHSKYYEDSHKRMPVFYVK